MLQHCQDTRSSKQSGTWERTMPLQVAVLQHKTASVVYYLCRSTHKGSQTLGTRPYVDPTTKSPLGQHRPKRTPLGHQTSMGHIRLSICGLGCTPKVVAPHPENPTRIHTTRMLVPPQLRHRPIFLPHANPHEFRGACRPSAPLVHSFPDGVSS